MRCAEPLQGKAASSFFSVTYADVQELKIRNGQDLWATAEDIIFEYLFLLEKYPQYPGMVYAIIDDTGLGGGVTDILRHEREARGLNQLEVIPVNFGASVPQEDAAANYADIVTWHRAGGCTCPMIQN